MCPPSFLSLTEASLCETLQPFFSFFYMTQGSALRLSVSSATWNTHRSLNEPGIKGSSVISLKTPVCKGHPPAQQPSMAPHCLHGKDQTSKLAAGASHTGVWPPPLSCPDPLLWPVTPSVCLSKLLVASVPTSHAFPEVWNAFSFLSPTWLSLALFFSLVSLFKNFLKKKKKEFPLFHPVGLSLRFQ